MHTIDRGARPDLQADCANCAGLCCVALAFAKSADFAVDKAAGEPCDNLDDGFRCTIHPHLRERGFKGCTVFDCFGAGQKVSQRLYSGQSWRDEPEQRASMFAVFPLVRQLQELLWYLDEARRMPAASALHPELERAAAQVEALTLSPVERILATDLDGVRAPIATLLREASRLTRASLPQRSAVEPATAPSAGKRRKTPRIAPGADLLGADLRGHDLRGADLRGALLIAADLRDADLAAADLIGADLRDADLAGADLRGALYLTQVQVNAGKGDARTRLPGTLTRPAHWHS
ncbi:pentapeptide repeat-containing protein [Leifsonia poae]|uniref:pentapeptide repeat-containing protein n=1 Tax=Leifsonia poae TaxID=110933 RepID=UPI001CC18D3A|nr:pentapeptide repeat-containing protein [Leifsonia poae]